MTAPITHDTAARTIHPQSIDEAGEDLCIALLDVARRLRSGEITKEAYDQGEWEQSCGTGCCILGHAVQVLGVNVFSELSRLRLHEPGKPGLIDLFYGGGAWPSRSRAADAIENYVFSYSRAPWSHIA